MDGFVLSSTLEVWSRGAGSRRLRERLLQHPQGRADLALSGRFLRPPLSALSGARRHPRDHQHPVVSRPPRRGHGAQRVPGPSRFLPGFDPLDSGNETTGLRLPSGVGCYDIPMLLQDKKFDAGGNLVYEQFNPEGFLGNHFLVSGKVQPYFRVEARKYRFRLLNGSIARYFEMYLADERDRNYDYTLIATDGNLLERPLTIRKILLGMAERADIIVDFSRFAPGTVLYLVNRIEQDDPRRPEDDRLYPGIRMLRIEGGERTPDPSVIPAFLRPMAPMPMPPQIRRREFKFERRNGQWAINGKFWDPDRVDAGGGWAHPIHVHLQDFRVLSVDGKAPPPELRGRKDTVVILNGKKVEILVLFNDFTGRYVMHCHQTAHEDHAMMIRFDVVA